MLQAASVLVGETDVTVSHKTFIGASSMLADVAVKICF